ncbi:hypothetical protein GC173_17345 [bacterium]|nr:hypothetical protein [bacterium]
MSAVETETPGATDRSQNVGRRKLVVFFGGVLLTAAAFVTTGMMLRESILRKAGPFLVEISNSSQQRLRADVIVEGRPFTLEMDPGEFGTFRYRLRSSTLVRLDIFEKNNFVHSVAEGPFEPGSAGELKVDIRGNDDIGIEFTAASETPQG